MVNSNIPMQGQPIDTATGYNNAAAMQVNNAQATQQMLQKHYEMMDDREKSRLTSTIVGAAQLKPFLDNNDIEGAQTFLTRRRAALHARMGGGEPIDTQETDYALQALRSGNVDQLKQEIEGVMAAGKVYGILDSGSSAPADVQSAEWYRKATPEQRAAYDVTRRAPQVVNLGGTQAVLNPSGGINQSYNVTPKPEQMPDFKFNQAQATAAGTAAGENAATATNTIAKLGGLNAALEALKTSSQNAPSGGIENIGATLANTSGLGGSAADAQGDFAVKRAAAENEIRAAFRVVGSGSQSDADAKPFTEMLPVASDSESVKVTKTDAAMQAVKAKVQALAAQRGLNDPFGQVSATPQQQPAQNKIRVSNPQTGEAFMIDAADLPAAQAEGFVQ